MIDMKCPMCNTNLEVLVGGANALLGCPRCMYKATDGVWQELMRTQKALEQSEICCTEWEKQALDYKAGNIALSGDLERTRKALDVAVDALKELKETVSNTEQELDMTIQAANALEQITALEQKE